MSDLIRPRALRSGDTLGVCAPAGFVKRDALEKGAVALGALGFGVRFADSVFEKTLFTAGSADRRAAELQALFADDQVAGILCARGGAGSGPLLERIDPAVVRAHPKVFVGYSDVTFLHLFLNRLGLVTFHGPMVAREWADGGADLPSFLSAVKGEGPPYASEPDDLVVLNAGTVEGRLRGGCLSILSAAVGTPWALSADPEGTILFIEDIDERPYRIDRMLFQMRAAGAFRGVRGIVFGDMKGCAPLVSDNYLLEEVIQTALHGLGIPVAIGLSSGHTTLPNVTLPLGARARLTCDGVARFEILEGAVS